MSEVQTFTASTPSCGNYSENSYAKALSVAYCPTEWKITGGGYRLQGYHPVLPSAASNAPDMSYPEEDDRWVVYAGGAPGASCFYSYALCTR